ncbi:MAG: outer membrane lipid asymmetry maintenance protein MlaD [Phenylobacterium sp.]|uniref:outer membrane lipid asymmetry maintenance protein MlaD n=1 Tax=Phenylobacterium sp. TaxID=1871053 RepID=UPI003BB8092B
MRGQWAETIMGVLVLGLAAAFLVYGLWTGGGGLSPRGYEVTAKFGEVGSLTPGAAVTVAGVKIGAVSKVTLEPDTYLAKVGLAIDPEVRLPADSTAKITSDSLLGGVHVAIGAGGAPEDLKPGGEIENTQGAVDLFGLIGQVVRPPAPASEDE